LENRELWLAQTFVELADTLVDEFDIVDFLSMLAGRCQELFAPSEVGFLIADHAGDLHVLASSSERLRLLELFELQNEEGPCFDAFRTSHPVLNQELAAPGPWPRFSNEAANRGYVMAHALPMRLRGVAIGSVNILQDHDRPVEALEANLAQTMADVATIGILQQRALERAAVLAEQLEGALHTRIVIEQAKGVLMALLGAPADDVFARMRFHARQSNRLLVDVAGDVVDGVLPAGSFPPVWGPGA
jgi:ANTAR domain-containing protein/GAF domain-containing protein